MVGAIPPVMGYMAASHTGWAAMLHPESIALSSLLFLWQFPHFFSLSYMHRDDYARGGFQMVAVNDETGRRSANLVWEYSLMLSLLPVGAWAGGLTSSMFLVEGAAVNAYLLYLAHQFRKEGGQTKAKARQIFLCSLWYLPLILAAMAFHSKNWTKEGVEDSVEDQAGKKLQDVVGDAKKQLKEFCVHELAVEKLSKTATTGANETKTNGGDGGLPTDSQPALCPKVASSLAIKKAASKVEQAADSIQSVAGTSTTEKE